jgi:hypothetical protein
VSVFILFFVFVLLGRHPGSMEGEQDVHGGWNQEGGAG